MVIATSSPAGLEHPGSAEVLWFWEGWTLPIDLTYHGHQVWLLAMESQVSLIPNNRIESLLTKDLDETPDSTPCSCSFALSWPPTLSYFHLTSFFMQFYRKKIKCFSTVCKCMSQCQVQVCTHILCIHSDNDDLIMMYITVCICMHSIMLKQFRKIHYGPWLNNMIQHWKIKNTKHIKIPETKASITINKRPVTNIQSHA